MHVFSKTNVKKLFFKIPGQLRGDVQSGQRLVPELVGSDDDTELLDRQRQAHEAMTPALLRRVKKGKKKKRDREEENAYPRMQINEEARRVAQLVCIIFFQE